MATTIDLLQKHEGDKIGQGVLDIFSKDELINDSCNGQRSRA